MVGFTRIDQSFFPPATRPQFMVDSFLPSRHDIRETDAFASDFSGSSRLSLASRHVTSFIGGGGLRFLLVYTPERENRAFVQFLVDVDDRKKIDGLIAAIQKHLDKKYPTPMRSPRSFCWGRGAADAFRCGSAARSGARCATRRAGGASPRRRRRGRVRAQRLAPA